jgi:hypothetical protein
MVVKIWNMVFWIIMQYSLIATYLYFRGAYCLHLQDRLGQVSKLEPSKYEVQVVSTIQCCLVQTQIWP